MPTHCSECSYSKCTPLFQEIKIVGRSRDKTARELMEAYHIRKMGDKCVSDTSVCLRGKEQAFLDLLKT